MNPSPESAAAPTLSLQWRAAAAREGLTLPVCTQCGCVQYPPREVCRHCLSEQLAWRPVDAAGTLLATTRLHRSGDPAFAARLPLRIGTVALDAGTHVIALLGDECTRPGLRVRVSCALDAEGRGVLHARRERAPDEAGPSSTSLP